MAAREEENLFQQCINNINSGPESWVSAIPKQDSLESPLENLTCEIIILFWGLHGTAHLEA